MDNKNVYDFTDVSDLSEEMQEALSTSSAEPQGVAQVVDIVVNAPAALTLKQIIAVSIRLGLELPAEVTVRNYVNRAVKDGRIVKVTRQSYWKPGSAVAVDAAEEDETVEQVSADALADL